jgi:hypothetical protein
MARTVRILDLDADTHAELDRRARAAGVSIDAYLTDLAVQHVRRSHVDQWLQRRSGAGAPLPASAVHEAFGDRSA